MSEVSSSWFVENGFDQQRPAETNISGELPLIVACQQGRAELVAALLNAGADVACLDGYGNNALWAACYAENEPCMQLLIDHHCDLNYRNPSGNSVLMFAASSGKDNMVAFLLRAGADPHLENHDGMTALDLASSRTCLKLLRSA